MLQIGGLLSMEKEDTIFMIGVPKNAISCVLFGFTLAFIYSSKGNLIPHPTGSATTSHDDASHH